MSIGRIDLELNVNLIMILEIKILIRFLRPS
jgi:hypothetical protein